MKKGRIKKRGKKKTIKQHYKESWNYIKETKNYIWFVLGMFVLFALFGFFLPTPEPLAQEIMKVIQELVKLTKDLNTLELIGFIFYNNLKTSFLGLILGIVFGIIPFFITIANGYIIGFVSKIVVAETGLIQLWRLLPHGIFEIPAIIISFALGVKFGTFLFTKNPKKELLRRFILGLKTFLFIVIPLLIIAAIIEGILIGVLS